MSEELFAPVASLSQILDAHSPKKIFLVTDSVAYAASGAQEKLKDCFSGQVVNCFDDFQMNPRLEDVEKGVNFFRENQCDFTIAIGGGSAIDVAKLVTSFAVQDVNPVEIIQGEGKIHNQSAPLVAIPTTAGTGSEVTHFGVVYIGNDKYSVADEKLLPDEVILDPELTMSLPASVTLASGLDALCQAIESCWSVQSTKESLKYAHEAVRLAWRHLKPAVLRPSVEDRKSMMLAAHLAGKAINISKTTAPHAFSYLMTKQYGIPHGIAVALTLSEFMNFNSLLTQDNCQDSRGTEFVKDHIKEILDITGCSNVEMFQSNFKELLRSLSAPKSLREAGVMSEKELDYLISRMNVERLANNPRIVSPEELRELLIPSVLGKNC